MADAPQRHSDDGALVLAVQQGDGDAFAELYRRHYPSVRRACTRRLFDAHEADEVAQATFVRAFERIEQCAGERRFGPWVHVIARSLCVDSFRAKARVEPREEPLAGGGRDHRPNEPEESLLHQERAAQVQEALASLPERQRRAVIARDWEGLRPGEIAERLGLSVGAVDSLLLRARRRLALSYRHLAGEAGGGASTSPIRTAVAGLVTALALGPQAVMTATATAAHAVEGAAGRAAGGVVGAVVSVALTLGGGPAEPAVPVPDAPPAVTVVLPVRPEPAPALRSPAVTRPPVAAAAVAVPVDPTPLEHDADRPAEPPAPVTPPSTAPTRAREAPPAPSTTTTTLQPPPPPPAQEPGAVALDLPVVTVTVPVTPVPTTAPVPPVESPKVTVPALPPVPDVTLPTLPLG